ncbi:hypothetical protein K523DRAFT_123189 [Schizophyllum commune Tattone D]|nr:hypothetical protein K523DRAFT_123189 [Schizophyllum commune Tattone D]
MGKAMSCANRSCSSDRRARRRGRCYPLRILGLYSYIGTPVWGRKSRKCACFTRTWVPEPLRSKDQCCVGP